MKKVMIYCYIFVFVFCSCMARGEQVVLSQQPTPVSIGAAAGIVMDYNTGQVLYEKNADTMLVPASITKVMTAYIVFEELEAGTLTLDTPIKISQNAANMSRNASYPMMVPLSAGGTVSVDMLLKLILLPSASASCVVIAEHISGSEQAFVARMNETAQRLGIDANYQNSHGALVHYTTVRAQAVLIREFIERFPDILRYTAMSSVTFNGVRYANTNRFVASSPYYGADGFKTGTISASGYCLAITAQRDGNRVISVVFKSATNDARYADSKQILDYSFALIESGSLIYKDIYAHPLKNEIIEFYNKGLSPYPSGQNLDPNTIVTVAEFHSILNSVIRLYGLENTLAIDSFDTGVLTKEKAFSMIDETIPLFTTATKYFADSDAINPEYIDAIARVQTANIDTPSADNYFYPTMQMTRANIANTTVALCRYIEENIQWLPTETVGVTAFDTPMYVTIPFIFNTYNAPYSILNPTGTYEPQMVQVVDALDGGWLQVSFDDTLHWIYTKGELVYAKSTQPLFNSSEKQSVDDVITPQIITAVESDLDTVAVSTWLGTKWITTNDTNRFFNDMVFVTPFECDVYEEPSETATQIETCLQYEALQVLEIAENGFWYVMNDRFEGWIDTQNRLLYTHTAVDTYSDPYVQHTPITFSSQIFHVEARENNFVKVATALGSRWIDYSINVETTPVETIGNR